MPNFRTFVKGESDSKEKERDCCTCVHAAALIGQHPHTCRRRRRSSFPPSVFQTFFPRGGSVKFYMGKQMNDENTILNHAVASNRPLFPIEGLVLKARTQIIWRRLTNTNIIQDSTQKKVDRNPRLSAFFFRSRLGIWTEFENSVCPPPLFFCF